MQQNLTYFRKYGSSDINRQFTAYLVEIVLTNYLIWWILKIGGTKIQFVWGIKQLSFFIFNKTTITTPFFPVLFYAIVFFENH